LVSSALGQDLAESPVAAQASNQEVVMALADSAQADWAQLFADSGVDYRRAQLMVEVPASSPWCGQQHPLQGVAYCPADDVMFVDIRLVDALASEASRQGQLARAYVLAHALGHHIQNLLGVTHKVAQWDVSLSRRYRQDLHRRTELQADCFAGLWFHQSSQTPALMQGQDLGAMFQEVAVASEQLRTLHGPSHGDMFHRDGMVLRTKWFLRGLHGGSVEACDTFIDERL
jgi:uncharacterized protein